MRFFNRPQPEPATDRQPTPNPLTIRLRHIDMTLEKLSQQQPRTNAVRAALDFALDRRLDLRPVPAAPVNPGCGDIMLARVGGQCCEICEAKVQPGELIASQPGTGGLIQHVTCPGREVRRG